MSRHDGNTGHNRRRPGFTTKSEREHDVRPRLPRDTPNGGSAFANRLIQVAHELGTQVVQGVLHVDPTPVSSNNRAGEPGKSR